MGEISGRLSAALWRPLPPPGCDWNGRCVASPISSGPPPSSEARVRTHGVEGSPPGSGGRDPSCLSGSGDPGLMSASPASSLWPLSLWVCVFCPRLDPRPPLYKDRRRQSGPQDHLSSRGPSLSHICRDPFPVRSQSRALGQGAAPHVQEPPASRVWTGH